MAHTPPATRQHTSSVAPTTQPKVPLACIAEIPRIIATRVIPAGCALAACRAASSRCFLRFAAALPDLHHQFPHARPLRAKCSQERTWGRIDALKLASDIAPRTQRRRRRAGRSRAAAAATCRPPALQRYPSLPPVRAGTEHRTADSPDSWRTTPVFLKACSCLYSRNARDGEAAGPRHRFCCGLAGRPAKLRHGPPTSTRRCAHTRAWSIQHTQCNRHGGTSVGVLIQAVNAS
eukprot:363901-Chlamydomonas_euryale.AAC.8